MAYECVQPRALIDICCSETWQCSIHSPLALAQPGKDVIAIDIATMNEGPPLWKTSQCTLYYHFQFPVFVPWTTLVAGYLGPDDFHCSSL